jgi:hypothetical protein
MIHFNGAVFFVWQRWALGLFLLTGVFEGHGISFCERQQHSALQPTIPVRDECLDERPGDAVVAFDAGLD